MKVFIFAVITVAAMSVSAVAQSKGIQGVWSLTEITTTGPNGKTRQMTQPSMYVFTKKHYSIIYVNSDSPRAELDDLSKASVEDVRSVFVESFIANAGTYEYKEGKITMHPTVAKAPGFMKPEVWVAYVVKSDSSGNTTLISDSSNNGQAANPTTLKLKRLE